MQSPTNTDERCSWAMASSVKGKAFDNIPTPTQYVQYLLAFFLSDDFFLRRVKHNSSVIEPIIILSEDTCIG